MSYRLYKLSCLLFVVGAVAILFMRQWPIVCRYLGLVFVIIYGMTMNNLSDRIIAISYLDNQCCRLVFLNGQIKCCTMTGCSVLTDWFIVLRLQSQQRDQMTYVALPGHPLWFDMVAVLRQMRLMA